ncbi:MAG: hypothetical protein U0457_20315 [Candidatus Sericytochromatia bacterium]
MKKIFLIGLTLIISGCITPTTKIATAPKTSYYTQNKEFEKYSGILFTGELNIIDAENSDNTLDEAIDDIKNIDIAFASFFDEKLKLLDSFTLKKDSSSKQNPISKFKLHFSPINEGKIKLKMNFSGKEGEIFYEKDINVNIKPKSLYSANLVLEQVSIKKDIKAKPKLKLLIDEIPEDSYEKNKIIINTNIKETDLKKRLEKDGIKVSELKKENETYTISFSEPSTIEALLLASKDNKFNNIDVIKSVK